MAKKKTKRKTIKKVSSKRNNRNISSTKKKTSTVKKNIHSTPSTPPKNNIHKKTTANNKKIVNDNYFKKIFNKILTVLKKTIDLICKFTLLFTKRIKNIFINFYNKIKSFKLAPKKNKKKEKIIKKKTKVLPKKTNDIDDKDNLVLLKYREHSIFIWIWVFLVNRGRVISFDMKRFGKKFKYGTLKDKILIILMILLILLFTMIIALCIYVIATAPDVTESNLYSSNSSVLYDKDGNEFARLSVGMENREKVTYDELPQVLVDAVVATEDSRFFQHNGIDIARFSKAVIGQLLGHSNAGGGSTLTMQISKNVATSSVSSGLKGVIRKFTDIYLAVFVIEKQYTKEQILEFYVNIPNLGSGAYGVEQASKVYFGKDVSQLNLVESATLAGLFQAPSSYNPYTNPTNAEKRRNQVLNLMCRHGYITEEERDAAQAVPIKSTLVGYDSSLNKYQRFVDTVISEVKDRTGQDPYTTSMSIYTTMDPAKQDVVNDVQNGVTYKFKNAYSESGIAVVDVDSGALVAVGSGRNQDNIQLSFNYATSARRHPGSTAKPIIDYGPAIEYLGWGTGQTLIDNEYSYTSGTSIKNWDDRFYGLTTAKIALAQSRNIPALYTFQQTTNEEKATFSSNLGWTLEDDGAGTILETCSIGGFTGVTPVESAAAYAAFARGGTYIEPYSFTKIIYNDTGEEYDVTPKKVQAMDQDTAALINIILKYAVTSGAVSSYKVSGTDLASKTGTTTVDSSVIDSLGITGNIIGDVWQVAYSPDYVISSWYGYPKVSADHYLTSSEGSSARTGIIKQLIKGIIEPNSTWTLPDTITEATIELGTDPVQLASEYTPSNLKSDEYYAKDSVPTTTSDRFSQLENPTNVKASSSGSSVNITWTGIQTPNAISTDYLTNYFSNNVYKHWESTYLAERLAYNSSYIGTLGYEVYKTDASGTVDLGFTSNASYTYTGALNGSTTFTVKSSYSIFKANMSSGATSSAVTGSSSGTGTTTETSQLTVTWSNGTDTIGFGAYTNLQSSSRIKVTFNGTTLTSGQYSYQVQLYVKNASGSYDAIDSNAGMTAGNSYRQDWTVTYGTNKVTKSLYITG